jgi:hypothetical protein
MGKSDCDEPQRPRLPIAALKDIIARLRSEPTREPLPPPTVRPS